MTNRFLTYVSYPTMSDETSETVPSTEKQLTFSRYLADELTAIGLSDVELDDKGYLYATLPANTPSGITLGLIAHVDTSDAVADAPIHTAVVPFEGKDICLNEEKQIYLKPFEYPSLQNYVGQHLIVTDGTTLLGADDKAGVCAIVTAAERVLNSNAPHGRIRICFTPDEEIGRGADHFDVEKFGADYAYTVDGGALGELEYENFNAASARVEFRGVSIHPGSAKDKMKNAQLMAMEFHAMLPANETPAHTEGYEGFYHLIESHGDCEYAELIYIIRDHDKAKFEEKKATLTACAAAIEARFGEGSCEIQISDSYANMKEVIDTVPHVIDRAVRAMKSIGMTPIFPAIRGGTDGARLSFMGLPCPNLGTGGRNAHSRFEFVSVDDMRKLCELCTRICTD